MAAPASVVSLNRLMNCPTCAGITLRRACGSTMRKVIRTGDRPSARAASSWPRRHATAGRRGRSRPRRPPVNSVNTMIARTTNPGAIDCGTKKPSAMLAISNSTKSGTPRKSSM